MVAPTESETSLEHAALAKFFVMNFGSSPSIKQEARYFVCGDPPGALLVLRSTYTSTVHRRSCYSRTEPGIF